VGPTYNYEKNNARRYEQTGREGLVLGIQSVDDLRGQAAEQYINRICPPGATFEQKRFRQEIS